MARNIRDLETERRAAEFADQLEEIAAHCASLPVLDDRRAEKILGYDDAGLPR
jgi:antitoxin VapB